MEEAQGVRLHKLAAVQNLPQQRRGFRNADAHDGVAGFGGSQQMADGADSADARRDGRHLVVRAALRELLKPPHLGDVQLGARHLSAIVKLDRDFGMALDSGNGVNRDLFHQDSLGHGSIRINTDQIPARDNQRQRSVTQWRSLHIAFCSFTSALC